MHSTQLSGKVTIITFSETAVAVLEHRGDPRLIANSVQRFIEWRKQNHLHPCLSATFNILHDDPDMVPPAEFQLDICAKIEREIPDNKYGIVGKTIPGGRCAVLRHTGSDEARLKEGIRYLVFHWLPDSGEVARDFPLFLQRVSFFPFVPEDEAVTDIFLPIA